MQGHVDELQLVHALKLAVVAANREGRVTFANDAASSLYGGTHDDLVGRPLSDFVVDTRTPEGGVDALTQVLAGEMWRGDLRIRHLDGTSFVGAVIATPLLAGESDVAGLVVFCEDITGQRDAAVAADATLQRLRLAHEAAQLGTWQWEIATGAVVWDERLEAIFGYAAGTFPQTFEAWLGGIHPDDVPEVLEIVNKAMDERSAYLLRSRVVWPDGKTVRSIESWGQVTTDADGNPTGTIGCLRDVTEEKEIERALEAAHEAQRLATRRTELLLDVTADFSGAATMRQVEEALVSHLREFSMLLGKQAALAVPEELTEVRSGRDLALQDYDHLPLPDQVLLDGLAAQCRAAAQRAHLMARTADIAEHLQLSLAASPLPFAEAFELAVHYAPGGDELEHVGGDWYDAVTTPSGSLAMIVGDVMGRGVIAATTMIRVRAGLRGLITVDPWPGHLLACADELLVRDAPDQFVTAVAALLDPDSGELHLCVAGHVPAIVVHPDGRTDTLGTGTGIPLGIDPGVTRATQTSMTEPGSILLLVTDGVVETRGADLDQGIAALRDQAVEAARPPAHRAGHRSRGPRRHVPARRRHRARRAPPLTRAAASRNVAASGTFTVEDVVTRGGHTRRGMDDGSDIYRRVVEATRDGLWMFDSSGITTFANRRMAELLGRDPEDMAGLSALEGLDEEGRAQFLQYLAELDAAPDDDEGGEGSESLLYRPDGSTIWVVVSHSPVRDDDGHRIGWLHRVAEHTEQKQLLDSLRHREQLLAAAQAIAQIGSWEWDVATDTVTWSDQLYRIYNVDPDEFAATYQAFLQFIHPEDRPMVEAAVASVFHGQDEFSWDSRIVRKGGEERWVRGLGPRRAGCGRQPGDDGRDRPGHHRAGAGRQQRRRGHPPPVPSADDGHRSEPDQQPRRGRRARGVRRAGVHDLAAGLPLPHHHRWGAGRGGRHAAPVGHVASRARCGAR